MAGIKKNYEEMCAFDMAKAILKDEKSILLWGNNLTECADFFEDFGKIYFVKGIYK